MVRGQQGQHRRLQGPGIEVSAAGDQNQVQCFAGGQGVLACSIFPG